MGPDKSHGETAPAAAAAIAKGGSATKIAPTRPVITPAIVAAIISLTHWRGTDLIGSGLSDCIETILALSEPARASHAKDTGNDNWWRIPRAGARKGGSAVTSG